MRDVARRRRDQMTAAEYQAGMLEAEMERTVRDLVTQQGGEFFHIHRSDRVPELAHVPDWLIVAPWLRSFLWIEAKSQERIVTPGQRALLTKLAECDRFVSGIVRPLPLDPLEEIQYDTLLDFLGGTDDGRVRR